MKNLALLLIATSFVYVLGCSKEGSSGAGAEAIDPAAQAEAAKTFTQRCATCHGEAGAGDGAAAAGLNPKPRNLQEAAWHTSVDDAYIEKIIKLGGAGVGKSAAMPPNPDLASNEKLIKALRVKVRSLKR